MELIQEKRKLILAGDHTNKKTIFAVWRISGFLFQNGTYSGKAKANPLRITQIKKPLSDLNLG